MKNDILITGALGDCVVLVTHMSPSYRDSIETVYWAARRGNALRPTIERMNIFPNSEHVVLCDHFPIKPFHDLKEVEHYLKVELSHVQDWSIKTIFPKILDKTIRYHSDPFLTFHFVEITDIPLPDSYIFIQGATPDNDKFHRSQRDLTGREWMSIVRQLEKMGITGVVVDLPGNPLPPSSYLLDRRGYSLEQGIEILKDPRCKGYWGIDSVFSILAAHRFRTNIRVRAVNKHFYEWIDCYMAPHESFKFVTQSLA